MTNLIQNIKQYFTIEELVSPKVYRKYGDDAWRFFDYKLLENLLYIREALGKSITINNWSWGGRFSQRGYRENLSQIVLKHTHERKLYLSAHTFAKALDFDVKGMTAEEVRIWIINSNIPHRCRLEKGASWVHMDVMPKLDQSVHVYQFRV